MSAAWPAGVTASAGHAVPPDDALSPTAVLGTSFRSMDRQVTLGFAGALMLLLGLSLYAHVRITALDESTGWVDHTHRVLEGVATADRLLADALADEQGYLLTGRRTYLSSHRETSTKLGNTIGSLRAFTRDNPVQQRRIDTLEALAAENIAAHRQLVALHDSRGREAALLAMAADAVGGESLMARYRELSARVAGAERDLLAERGAARAAQRQHLGLAMQLRGLAALVILVLAMWRIRSALAERGRAERERDRHAAELRRQALELETQNEELIAQGDALRAAMDQAESANRAKSAFLAQMSHELRTPLNSVIGFANIVRRNSLGALGAADITYLDRIAENGRQLLRTINSILDLSKIEAEQESVELELVSLGSLVAEVLAHLEPQATAGGVALLAELPAPLASIVTDTEKFRRVLINLVANAVKFTKSGGLVTVRIETMPRAPTSPAAIVVHDTGMGIAPDRLAAIFEAFEQGDVGVGRQFGGTGLGLSISRALCRLLHCELTVTSMLGEGSVFRIGLPTDGALASMPPLAQHSVTSSHTARA